MGHDELQRMMGTAGLGVWMPADGAPALQGDNGILSRLGGVRTRLSAWLGRGRASRG